MLSDIMGESGLAILDALAAGESDPQVLAGRVRTQVRASRAELVAALRGRMSAHQRLLLRLHLAQTDALDAASTGRWATARTPFARPSRS